MRTAICLTVLVLLAGALAGCGQKGPLVRPEQPAPAVSPVDDDAQNR